MKSIFFLKKSLVFTFIIFLLFFISPLLLKIFKKNSLDNLIFMNVIHKIKSENDTMIVINAFNYIKKEINEPKDWSKLKDNSPINILKNKIGSCDQHAILLKSFLDEFDIPNKVLFLRGNDSNSKHTVLEVEYRNRRVIIDPFYKQLFYNKQGKLASFKDFQIKNIAEESLIYMNKIRYSGFYLGLYSENYPRKIFKVSPTAKVERMKQLYFKIWLSFFGDFGYQLVLGIR